MAGKQGEIVGLIGLLGDREQKLPDLFTVSGSEQSCAVDVPGLDGMVERRSDPGLAIELDIERGQRHAVDHPLGARGEDLKVPAREHRPDGVDLIGHDAELDGLAVEPGAEVEIPQIGRLRQPQPVGQIARAADHQPVLVKAGRNRPAAHRREGLLVPIDGGGGAGEGLLANGGDLGRRGDGGDQNLFAADAETQSGMARDEYRRRGGGRDLAGGTTRGQGDRGVAEAVIGLAQQRPFGEESPLAEGPGGAAGAGELARRDVGMTDQQGVGALGPVDLAELGGGPGRGHRGDADVVFIDVDPALGESQEVGLLGVELEGDQPAGSAQGVDIGEAGAAGKAAGGVDEDVGQAAGAVVEGLEVAASEQIGRDFPPGEVGFVLAGHGHQFRASIREKRSKPLRVSCWPSISRARRNSWSAS